MPIGGLNLIKKPRFSPPIPTFPHFSVYCLRIFLLSQLYDQRIIPSQIMAIIDIIIVDGFPNRAAPQRVIRTPETITTSTMATQNKSIFIAFLIFLFYIFIVWYPDFPFFFKRNARSSTTSINTCIIARTGSPTHVSSTEFTTARTDSNINHFLFFENRNSNANQLAKPHKMNVYNPIYTLSEYLKKAKRALIILPKNIMISQALINL